MEERDYEAEALEQGWNPDFDGPNKTDAKTFVEKGEKIAGIATKRADSLKSELNEVKGQIRGLQVANKEFGEYHKKALESQRKQNAQTIAELEGQLAQAVTDGDGQAYARTNREINDLKTELPPEGSVGADPDVEWDNLCADWASENKWYNDSPKLNAYANGLAGRIQAEGYSGKAYFTELSRRVKEDMPGEFENKKKDEPNTVEDGGSRKGEDSKAHTFENLDADAKAACKKFVAEGFMTKEDYIKGYEWD